MMISNEKTFIYSLSDDKNYIKYIGKSDNPEERIKEHILESKNGRPTHKNNWIKTIIKNNEKPKLDIIDIVDKSEWQFWEEHYISLYKSWGFKLTNLTKGGNGTGSGVSNPNYGKKLTEEHKQKCSNKLKGEKNPFFGKKHTEETLKKIYKPVLQYDLDGNFINEWKSINHAEKTLKLKSISSCCNNKLLSVGGYIWKFKLNNIIPKKIKINKTYKKIVYQYTLDNVFIKKWNSVSEAQKSLKIQHISKVCNNYKSHKSSGGFLWSYILTKNI